MLVTKINDPANLNGKLFAYELKYQNPVNPTVSPAKYNGNIAQIDWKTSNDDVLRRYSYQYDPLNRLKKGFYSEPGASVPQNDFYNEETAYDLNGNITSLQRNSKGLAGAELIDNLSYNYMGNRLTSVTDNSSNYSGYPDISGNTIAYDDNGNMKDQIDKGILQIDYNHLSLPNKLKFNQSYIYRNPFSGTDETRNVTTQYLYRADGVKLSKNYTFGVAKNQSEKSTITDYLDGFQYEGTGSPASIISRTLKFVPTSEGYYNFENNKYIYHYTDHLGNVRLSYTKNSSGIGTEIIEENNYYPFGLKHEGYNVSYNNPGYNPSYKYGYNGKELQEETGMYDYGARFYMPDLGRWGVIDPLAEKYNTYSPYNYCVNNPILYVDPDGRDGVVTGTGTVDDPYVITANYYYYGLSNDQTKGLNASISEYNNKGKAREIKTKEGKIYVKFNLSAIESKDEESANTSAKNDMGEGADGKNVRWGNVITNESLKGSALGDADRLTIRSDNDKVMGVSTGNGLNPIDIFKSTFNHEIGHNIGGVHGDPGGLMDPTETFTTYTQQISSGGSSNTTFFNNASVTNDAVRAIMGRVGQTTQVTSAKGNVFTSSYGIVNSIYLNAKENTKIQQMSPDGSVGKISRK